MKSTNKATFKRFCVALHRDLGYLFAGVILIYAISGLFMNHRNTINPSYSVKITEFTIDASMPRSATEFTQADVMKIAERVGEADNLIKHFVSKGDLKLLFKGGSSLVVDLDTRTATYEHVSRRFVVSDMVRLHYNPGSWWSAFSDIFAVCLIIITLTGLVIVSGRKGIIGRGGILLLIGIIIPIIFLMLSASL